MELDGSVTNWIHQMKGGDQDLAVTALWKRYFETLVRYAGKKLQDSPRRVEDEEDIALSAFNSFCGALRKGRFPDLADRNGLSRILFKMTARKVVDRIRYYDRDKRRVQGESALANPGTESGGPGMAQIPGRDPPPDFSAIAEEEFSRLLDVLGDARLRQVALLKLDGLTDEAIAGEMDCSLRTVERQLALIRKIWDKEPRSD